MSRHPFDLLMELDPDHIRLDCAALHLARDVHRDLNISRYLRRLDELADEVAALRPGLSATLRYEALRKVLVEGHGLRGSRRRYYEPDSCYLNCVLDQRRGIPIALSMVWIEVARRLKWPVYGVALPGRFIVRFDDPERFVLADPFRDGRPLSVRDCRRIVRRRFGRNFPFTRRYLRPVDGHGVLARLLRNLRNVYLARYDLPNVARILERMAALEPRNGRHLQDLAAVCYRQGDVRTACAHLQRYLQHRPNADDYAHVQDNLKQLEATLVAMN